MDKGDDAGVYLLNEEQALIQTLDFFTPIVDDPETFGRIAAANALSDVYAMGGEPLCAMNIVCFPVKKMDMEILQGVLRGGMDKLKEAGCVLAGGHSVEDNQFMYGLSVSGLVHPKKLWTNQGALPGDALVLSKRLGTGIVSTAIKAGRADQAAVEEIIASMEALNRATAIRAQGMALDVHACTDVTGFGLLGHMDEMLSEGIGFEVDSAEVPIFEKAMEYAAMGLLPGGLHRNRKHVEDKLQLAEDLAPERLDLLCDAQTSGGLLLALPPKQAEDLVQALREEDGLPAAVIGRVNSQSATITIR